MKTCHVLFVVALIASLACQKDAAQTETAAIGTPAASQSAVARPDSGGADSTRAYCEQHACYEDLCIFCNAELRDAGRLWCKEHDRYEDRCFECHPELKDPQRAYCEKHFLYEDECFMCNPALRADSGSGVRGVQAGQVLMCAEHKVPENECGICHPDLLDKLTPGAGLKIRFASRDAAAKGGIETALPRRGQMADAIECYGEIAFNQNRLARVAAPVDGMLQQVHVDLGDRVPKGQVVAAIWSVSIGEAVARAVLAEQTVARERALHAEGISSEKDFQEADASSRAARQQLKTLGFDDRQIETLAAQSVETAVLELRAPFGGEVVERNAVQGSLADAGTALFTIADRSVMWAMLNVPEKALSALRVGQRVEIRADAIPERTFTGTLTWIAAQVDERTRMARARAEVSDPAGQLRAQMFVHARVLTGNADHALLVPNSAVQCIDDHQIVFIKVADDLYEARPVRLGPGFDGHVAIAEGLSLDEAVVVSGAFVAKSQLLISRLGAGCVDE